MSELTKITDVSSRYSVTTRTLRYYEDIGLITSVRDAGYAYRMYDENAIKKLTQILILRKLNISMKEIKRIFEHAGSEVVLDVLSEKVNDIDDEVALLHELKEIVLAFIQQINDADFSSDADIKLLYDKAKKIEAQITNVDYNGSSSNTHRLIEVTEQLEEKNTSPVIVNVYKQSLPPTRFIGLKHESGGEAWDNWNDTHYALLKNLPGVKDVYEDSDALIGLMNHRNGFEYWLGFFTPANTPVPEGYQYEDFPQMEIGACWIYKHEDYPDAELAVPAFEKMKEEGYMPDGDWWFERYHPVRCESDKNGYGILDICFMLKGWR